MSPFLDMFSMSSTLVKPLHLQAILGGTVGSGLETRLGRTGFTTSAGPLASDSDVTASGQSRARQRRALAHSPTSLLLLDKQRLRQSGFPQSWPLVNRLAQDTSDRPGLIRVTLAGFISPILQIQFPQEMFPSCWQVLSLLYQGFSFEQAFVAQARSRHFFFLKFFWHRLECVPWSLVWNTTVCTTYYHSKFDG